jgi:hypothetical protein
MAGGDLLYIVAFIILPTAVLVSCIWALVLLRNGRLLPARPVARYKLAGEDELAGDDVDNEPNLVEETGEHVVIAPAAPMSAAPVVADPAPAAIVAEERVPVAPAPVPFADEPSPAERTQEMAAVPVGEPAVSPQPPAAPANVQMAAVEDESAPSTAPVPETQPADAAPSAEAASDLLLVPLDEPLGVDPNPRGELARVNGAQAAPSVVETNAAAEPAPSRRAPRRVGMPRQSHDAPARTGPRTGQRRAARRSEGEG